MTRITLEAEVLWQNVNVDTFHKRMTLKKGVVLCAPMGNFDPMPSTKPALIPECRKGVPAEFRGQVWRLSCSLESVGLQTQNVDASHKAALLKVLGPGLGSDGELNPPTFGGVSELGQHCLSKDGTRSFHRLCLIFQQLNALGYCPVLLDLIPIMLIYMTEAEVLASLTVIFKNQRRELEAKDQVLRKIQTNYPADISIVRTFKSVLEWRYKKLATLMKESEAYDDVYFLLLFTKLFTGFLPLPVVLRIIDVYLMEGPKMLCRVLMSMMKIHKKKIMLITAHGQNWWDAFRAIINSPDADYDRLLSVAFRWRYALMFKRSRIRKIHMNLRLDPDVQERAAMFGQNHPLEIVDTKNIKLLDGHRDYYFRSWLPMTIQMRKMRLLYTTEAHGRGLDTLYRMCGKCRRDSPMLLLIEVLDNGMTIGALTSHPISFRKTFYGDGRTFVFRLHPDPEFFKCPYNTDDDSNIISPATTPRNSIISPAPSPRKPRVSRASRASRASRNSQSRNNSAICDDEKGQRSEYILALRNFLAIGVNHQNSAAAIRINEELTKGSSEETETFLNPPLAGDKTIEFEIGHVEVYDFVYPSDLERS